MTLFLLATDICFDFVGLPHQAYDLEWVHSWKLEEGFQVHKESLLLPISKKEPLQKAVQKQYVSVIHKSVIKEIEGVLDSNR